MRFEFNSDKTKLILKESTKQEYNQLKLHLNRLIDGYFYKKKNNPRLFYSGWDGIIEHFHNGHINIGLWQEIYKCCKDYGFPFDVDKKQFPFDNTITPEKIKDFCDEFFKDYKDKEGNDFSTYEHQLNAVAKLLKYKYAITEVATSGGKTLICFILVAYILRYINPNAKFLFIVPNITLVVQMNDDFYDYNNGFNKEQQNPLTLKVEEIMSDHPRKVRDGETPNVYIGTYQSLISEFYTIDFFKQFTFVLTDECLHPDTLITMSDKTKKKIKDVNIGDKVYTYNEITKDKEIKEVEYVYKNLSINQQMYEIELENGNILKITGNHKVKLTNGLWKRVDELTLKDEIIEF
jgi:hypothetical protein